MSNLEIAMKALAAAMTGSEEGQIPGESLEEICWYMAENAPPVITQVEAPEEAAGDAPTKAEFDAVIEKLKEAKVFK